ncbi:MAG: hypothetical protein ACI4SB_01650 [Acutalibacteraceae bacterium]
MAIIKNETVVDLTQYSSAALSKITSMTNVALVLLPAGAPEEYYEAYAQIKKENIANTIQIPSGKIVTQVNGTTVITAQEVAENAVVISNGITVLKGFDDYKGDGGFYVNGVLVKSKNCAAKIYSSNGITMTMPDDDFECSIWGDSLTVDKDMIRHLKEKTLIICGNKLFLDESVSEQLIEEKDIRFLSGYKIIAPKKIIGCVKARSTVGFSIVEAEEHAKYPSRKEEVLADLGQQKKHRRFFGRKK